MTHDILVLIHGITPEPNPDVTSQYTPFLKGLKDHKTPLSEMTVIPVDWGVTTAGSDANRPDRRLALAQERVTDHVRFERIMELESPGNNLLDGFARLIEKAGDLGFRLLLTRIRERLIQFGIADAVYYTSPDGERAVREAVYGSVLRALSEPDDDPVRLHVVGHSLGGVIGHDFLFGLFNPDHEPDFCHDVSTSGIPPAEDRARQLYATWRNRAQDGQLTLGTFVTLASQLPLFVMRTQRIVDLLASGGHLDPRVIGIQGDEEKVRWANFYDIDDVLGFGMGTLYGDSPALEDNQVQTGFHPVAAHQGYWDNETVIRRCAELIKRHIV